MSPTGLRTFKCEKTSDFKSVCSICNVFLSLCYLIYFSADLAAYFFVQSEMQSKAKCTLSSPCLFSMFQPFLITKNYGNLSLLTSQFCIDYTIKKLIFVFVLTH